MLKVEHSASLRFAGEIHAAGGMSEIARKASSEIKLALNEIASLACLGVARRAKTGAGQLLI